jgi:hypothetical protein
MQVENSGYVKSAVGKTAVGKALKIKARTGPMYYV